MSKLGAKAMNNKNITIKNLDYLGLVAGMIDQPDIQLELSASELLERYKSQQRVERGFRFLKSPEFLCDALYLKKPKRIEALLMIMTLSLMVYAALEYTIRKELKKNNQTFPNQVGKQINNPTTRWVFESFFAIHLLITHDNPNMVIGLLLRHKIILDVLGKHYWNFYR